MKTLSIKKSEYYFRPFYMKRTNGKKTLYDPYIPRNIIVVGCGGNGAYLVPLIARFLSQSPADMIKEINLTLIDGDTVEEKNILRQNFIPTEMGMNKAEALAERCNRAFGMNVTAIPEYLTESVMNRHIGTQYNSRIIIGCVDRHEVRNLMSKYIQTQFNHSYNRQNSIYIDVGNELDAGQLFISGPVHSRDKEPDTIGSVLIHDFYPQIASSDVKKASPSCDVATAAGLQRMVVNVKAATLAFEAMESLLSPAEIPYYEVTFGPGTSRTFYFSDLQVSPRATNQDGDDLVTFKRA